MKKRLLLATAVIAISASVMAQQIYRNLEEFKNSRLDALEPERQIRSACYRVGLIDDAANELLESFRVRDSRSVELALLKVSHKSIRASDRLSVANDGENLSSFPLTIPDNLIIGQLIDGSDSNYSQVVNAMIVLTESLADLSTNIVNGEEPIEKIGVVVDTAAALNQSCSWMLGLEIGIS